MWKIVLVISCWRLISTGTTVPPLGVTVSPGFLSAGTEERGTGGPVRLHLPEAIAELSGRRASSAGTPPPDNSPSPPPPHNFTSPRRPTPPSTSPPPPQPDSDEYYSSYAEYPETISSTFNATGYRGEAGILPEPGELGDEGSGPGPGAGPGTGAEAPDIQLPDDSLADTDLHDHDLIDSVMYIYFGASSRDQTGPGRQVLIVGAVIALVAQFLTLASGLKRIKSQSEDPALLILLNTELALTVSNLVFMLGVQATGDTGHCEMVAITLHYLHLVICCWFFNNCLHIYRRLRFENYRPRIWIYCLIAWAVPALLVYVCTKVNKHGYESRDYCWMSVEKGMLFSFMVPVAILMLVNTVLAVLGLRLVAPSKEQESERKSLRMAASLLPLFAIVWFLGVVALENSASLVFPLLFLASNGFLNWFVFICWLPTDISAWRESEEDFDEEDEELFEEQLKSQLDDQPLLQEVYVCGRRDDYDLQMDPICTISS